MNHNADIKIDIENGTYLGFHPEIPKDFHLENKCFFVADKIVAVCRNDLKLKSNIEMITGNPVVLVETKEEFIETLLEKYLGYNSKDVFTVESIIEEAILDNASDIHFESHQSGLCVKIRKDGSLFELYNIRSKNEADKFIMKIKVLSGCDIGETMIPQDGRFTFASSKGNVEVRCSILPCAFNESAVLRIHQTNEIGFKIDTLGFDSTDISSVEDSFSKPSGFYLFSGPTGSGKTTTAYTCIERFRKPDQKLVTVEDPIEYILDNSVQMKINRKKNVAFFNAVRSVVRHDPDIIFIGEIRDLETAAAAIEFALTGHKVIATIHASSAFESIERLLYLGVKRSDLLSCLKLIIDQRLVKKICVHCNGNGCNKCRKTGYLGRTGIFEIINIKEKIRQKDIFDEDQLEKIFDDFTVSTLKSSAEKKFERNITDLKELSFVLGEKK